MKTLGILALIGFLLALIYAFGLFWHAAFFAGRCLSGTIEFISIVPARLACVPTESGGLTRDGSHGMAMSRTDSP